MVKTVEERRVSNRERMRNQRKRDPEHARNLDRERYKRDREKVVARSASYRTRYAATLSAKRKADYAANPEKYKNNSLRFRYGITLESYGSMLKEQNYKCAICGKEPLSRGLDTDHNHHSGEVRGLLTSDCNIGLGLFKDDPVRLLSAIEYLSVGEVG